MKKSELRQLIREELKSTTLLKKGDTIRVDYPNLIKPIKGKITYVAKFPDGSAVYGVDHNQGVWQDKYVTLIKSANESIIKEGTRPIYQIADEIRNDWRPVNYAAKPYLDAMSSLDKITDKYGMDSYRSIVAYFLSNAAQWKGETAKAIKLELKALIK